MPTNASPTTTRRPAARGFASGAPVSVVDAAVRDEAARRCGRRGVLLPTFAELREGVQARSLLLPKGGDAGRDSQGGGSGDEFAPSQLFACSWVGGKGKHARRPHVGVSGVASAAADNATSSLSAIPPTTTSPPTTTGAGKASRVQFIEVPRILTGGHANRASPATTAEGRSSGAGFRIVCMVGSGMPTGAHKVGPAYSCLVSKLVTGQVRVKNSAEGTEDQNDAAAQSPSDDDASVVVWPSTGNFCRGGAWIANLLGCRALAVLPEDMSHERFEWLQRAGADITRTPGGESNVREIYDECKAVKRRFAERGDGDRLVIVNQFAEFNNGLFHYAVTGEAILEAMSHLGVEQRHGSDSSGGNNSGPRLRAFVSATGSAGTIAAGDRLKEVHRDCKIVASEALQCPTLLENGFGYHRVEGIGDKHVPWIHNVRNTDVVVAADDEHCIGLFRLFNEPVGRELLHELGVPADFPLDLFGLSGLHNLVSAIKTGRTLGFGEDDIVVTMLTDSAAMYTSRLEELNAERGQYTREQAVADLARNLDGLGTENVLELTDASRRRIHNLKYYTWIEQQGEDVDELDAQWSDPEYWTQRWRRADDLDVLIREFNVKSGLGPKRAPE